LPKIAEETAPRHPDLEFLMSVLVLVATGKFGRLLPPELVKAGLPAGDITATGRNQEVLAALAAQGFRTAQVDLSDAGQVAGAVAGQDKVVLISGNEPTRLQQHLGVIEAAKAAGVHHFYYTSGTRVEDLTYALGADHRATENAIKDCDDVVVHCRSKAQAAFIRDAIGARMEEVGLQLHPDKMRPESITRWAASILYSVVYDRRLREGIGTSFQQDLRSCYLGVHCPGGTSDALKRDGA
jgi:hypothetical protein